MISLAEHKSVTHTDGTTWITFTVAVPSADEIGGAMQAERSVQQVLNNMGQSIMEHTLARYDTNGEPIELGRERLTSKGRSEQTYQSLFGPVSVARHVYQKSAGGVTFCPMEDRARIIENATCQFAAVVAAKYSAQSGRAVARDLEESLQRSLSLDYLQTLSARVGDIAVRKEAHWTYAPQTPRENVVAFVMGIDGACVAIGDEGWKQAMVGSISLLDAKGERLETIYQANVPEEGKATFFARMEREVKRLKQWCPEAPWLGICDGAHDLQQWLERHCDLVMLDFYHLSEYVSAAAGAFEKDAAAQSQWLQSTLHALKHDEGAAPQLVKTLERKLPSPELSDSARESVADALRYLQANAGRTHYAQVRKLNLPIGSGVTEAACKHIIKERACGSGMRWQRKALQGVLALRSLHESSNRWGQFWSRIERFGK